MAKAPRYEGLTAHLPCARAARIVVGALAESILASAPNVLRGEDTRAVHDMRVDIRRLRGAMVTFDGAFPAKRARRFGRAIRRIGRKLGPVRDADVHLATLRATLGGAPDTERIGIAFAIETILEARRSALATFAIELSQFDRATIAELLADA